MFFIPITYFPIFLINTMSSIQTISIIQGSYLFHHITYIYAMWSIQLISAIHSSYVFHHTSHIYDMSSIQLISAIHGSHVFNQNTYSIWHVINPTRLCHPQQSCLSSHHTYMTCHQSNSFPPSTAVMSFITSHIYDRSSIQLISAIHGSHVFHHITYIWHIINPTHFRHPR